MQKKTKWYVTGILFVGAVIGIAFVGLLHSGVHLMGNEKFCGTFCHSMDLVYSAYKKGSHYNNKIGMSADCSDCHLKYHSNEFVGPVDYVLMLVDKGINGSISGWGEIRGTMNTLEKQLEKRPILEGRVIHHMQEQGWSTCQGCHKFEHMADPKKPYIKTIHMALVAPNAHEKVNCIECHKNVAHNYEEGDKAFPELEQYKKDLEAKKAQAQ